MALMQSCCCWRSVRRGSFACALYTGIYFALLAVMMGNVLRDEHQYMWGDRSLPKSMSFLESENMSHVTVGFCVSLFISSCFGVISCLLLLFGLFKDRRRYLLPWILNVITTCLIDIAHSLYLFVSQGHGPIAALMYTFNFFLLCLNVYALLCVISQYQEYVAGRGRAIDDYEHRIPAIRYAVQPTTTTATSCLSSKRAVSTNNDTKGQNAATIDGSPTESPNSAPRQQTIITSLLDKSLTPIVAGKTSRKHVQFPDEKRESISNQGTASSDDNSISQGSFTTKKDILDTPASLSSPLLSPSRIPQKSQSQQQQYQQPTRQQQQSTSSQAES